MPEDRLDEYLNGLDNDNGDEPQADEPQTGDAACDWFPEWREPYDEAHYLRRWDSKAMHLRAYDAWGEAYGRGLVTAPELSAFLRVADASAYNWKAWADFGFRYGRYEVTR